MKINDKLNKVSESFTVYRYDNGFMLEISGRDSDNEWKTAKITCTSKEQLIGYINEALSLPLSE